MLKTTPLGLRESSQLNIVALGSLVMINEAAFPMQMAGLLKIPASMASTESLVSLRLLR